MNKCQQVRSNILQDSNDPKISIADERQDSSSLSANKIFVFGQAGGTGGSEVSRKKKEIVQESNKIERQLLAQESEESKSKIADLIKQQDQDSMTIMRNKKQEQKKAHLATIPIGKAKNYHMWNGRSKWRMDGRVMTGPQEWKLCFTTLAIFVTNALALAFNWIVSKLNFCFMSFRNT